MNIQFEALPTEVVRQIRASGKDAYGLPVERLPSDGSVYPCRHCLGGIPNGQDYLILAHRPFSRLNPYSETGPIFLCAHECTRAENSPEIPRGTLRSETYLVRGYNSDDRIIYGTGKVTKTEDVPVYAQMLLDDPNVAYLHVRSASNNCYLCRISRR